MYASANKWIIDVRSSHACQLPCFYCFVFAILDFSFITKPVNMHHSLQKKSTCIIIRSKYRAHMEMVERSEWGTCPARRRNGTEEIRITNTPPPIFYAEPERGLPFVHPCHRKTRQPSTPTRHALEPQPCGIVLLETSDVTQRATVIVVFLTR